MGGGLERHGRAPRRPVSGGQGGTPGEQTAEAPASEGGGEALLLSSETTDARTHPLQARAATPVMILPQVHLRKPCYDFYFL